MKPHFIFLLSLLLIVPTTMSGQQRDALVVFSTRDKAGSEILELFRETESLHFQDPKSPRFMLIDKKQRYSLGIGGFVKVRVASDFNGENDPHGFSPYNINVPNSTATNGRFDLDAGETRIFLKLVGKNRVFGNYSAYIETDFLGPDYSLRLRQAYISARGFLVGQTWTTFTDLAALSPTIDFEGPCSNTAFRNVQIRYTYNFDPRWQLALAAEIPATLATLGDDTRSVSQRMPDIPLYLQYNWKSGSHIRASGILRGMTYNDRLTDQNRSVFGWGVQLSSVAQFCNLTFYGQGVYGKGIARYIDDLNNGELDMVPDKFKPGYEQALPMWGAYGGLKYNFTKDLFISGTYSQVRIYSSHDSFQPASYRYGQYAVGNLFYNLTPDCQIGVEYLWGKRMNVDGMSGKSNRVQAMIEYNF